MKRIGTDGLFSHFAAVMKFKIKNEKNSQIILENNSQLCYSIFRLEESISSKKLTLLNIIHTKKIPPLMRDFFSVIVM